MKAMKEEIIEGVCKVGYSVKYAVLEVYENVTLDIKIASDLRHRMKNHFGNNDFVLITNRKHRHEIDLDIYRNRRLKNLKGLAVVSNNQAERERAQLEQTLFEHSFAFFENINDAVSWAESFIVPKS